mmetsp:Transcript_37371/g.80975  ORF Transcript_37371/g.80975 Transcript_37371/m.80975 type:complete len:206 (-) Transcript_37371:48-665(-)
MNAAIRLSFAVPVIGGKLNAQARKPEPAELPSAAKASIGPRAVMPEGELVEPRMLLLRPCRKRTTSLFVYMNNIIAPPRISTGHTVGHTLGLRVAHVVFLDSTYPRVKMKIAESLTQQNPNMYPAIRSRGRGTPTKCGCTQSWRMSTKVTMITTVRDRTKRASTKPVSHGLALEDTTRSIALARSIIPLRAMLTRWLSSAGRSLC